MYTWSVGNRKFNALLFGLLGGLAGSIIMGLIAYATPAPNTGGDPFFIATAGVFGFGNLAWAVGWLLHVITGMAIGIVFGVLAARGSVGTQRLTGRMMAGVLVGLAAWVALFIPMMFLITPAAVSTQALSSGLVLNVTFGLILVVVFGIGQSFAMVEPEINIYRCAICGFSAPTKEALAAHRHEAHGAAEDVVQTSAQTPART